MCADDGTVFRINSAFMDVSDQPFCSRQWTVAAVLVAVSAAVVGVVFASIPFVEHQFSPEELTDTVLWLAFSISMIVGFSYLAFWTGRDEFFSLTRRTIRFHRYERKIYLVRRRRFFAKQGEGDICWEIPWSDKTFFCIHKGKKFGLNNYQIMGYQLDDAGCVERAFAIGKDWLEDLGLEYLLAQWNYYRTYMEEGPEAIPAPMVYLAEKENIRESFLHCVYEFDHSAGIASRIIFLPIFLILTIFRVLSLATCRAPIWPAALDHLFLSNTSDVFVQPSGNTPIGWAETVLSKHRNEYPHFPRKEIKEWSGPAEVENAKLWAADSSPINDVELFQ
jgi:hypothetical protein